MEEQMLWISIPHKQLIGLGFFIRELCLLVQNFIFLCHSVITTFHFSSGKNQKHYINTFVKGTHFTSNIVCRHESLSHLLDLPLSLESSHLHELLRRCRSRGSGSAGLSHQPGERLGLKAAQPPRESLCSSLWSALLLHGVDRPFLPALMVFCMLTFMQRSRS